MRKVSLILLTLVFAGTAFASEPTKPVATNTAQVFNSIEYPLEARMNAVEGNVKINVFVDKDGNILKYKVKSACDETLQKAIEEVIEDLIFIPAKDEDGNATVGMITIPFQFRLDVG